MTATEKSKQYWLDFIVVFHEDGTTTWTPLQNIPAGPLLDRVKSHECAEVLIPYHAPDGKKYGFTCYLVQLPNGQLAIVEMMALKDMAPAAAKIYGSLCEEVEVDL